MQLRLPSSEGGDLIGVLVHYERLPMYCFLCGMLDHKCSQCHLFKGGVVDDTCVPYGKWLQAGYPTLGSAHGKPGESSDNRE